MQRVVQETLPALGAMLMVLLRDMPAPDGHRQAHRAQAMEGPANDAVADSALIAPVDIVIRLWLDRDPDVLHEGLAPWLVAQALARAYELIDEGSLEEPEEEEE